MATQLNDSYQTDGSNNQISVSVGTGFAQSYTTSVTLDGNPVSVVPPADHNGNYADDFAINIGTNVAVAGLLLEITAIAAILLTPPNTAMNISISGGSAPKLFVLDDPGAGMSVGDTVRYYASIALI